MPTQSAAHLLNNKDRLERLKHYATLLLNEAELDKQTGLIHLVAPLANGSHGLVIAATGDKICQPLYDLVTMLRDELPPGDIAAAVIPQNRPKTSSNT